MIIVLLRRLSSFLLSYILVMLIFINVFAVDSIVRVNYPDEEENVPFSVENMFPGDAETKEFVVKVSHKKPVVLYFHADIRAGYEKFAEVIRVRVELSKKHQLLYDGLMRDMPDDLGDLLLADEKEVTYQVSVYLDTSVGNAYQFERLVADFRWWYGEEGEETSEDISTADPDAPSTGDDALFGLYLGILVVSAILLLFLLILRLRKKEEE